MNTSNYEAVIGLEIHIQLNTLSKVYSGDSAAYGASPNAQVNPISLGHPGTLPKVNEEVLNSAIKLGLACNCNISAYNEFARKNYFYADLPKGYQITQNKTPICTGGHIEIKDREGKSKRINLTRIHMEEDSGKSIHDQDPYNTLIDLNRAGVGLLEMVSEPEIRSAEEAYNYVSEVRKLVRYLEICDGNMEEGSMRCDANISVRIKGETAFGQRTEVKNMNSIRNVQRAIEHEVERQIAVVESGGSISMETRSFDAVKGTTAVMRSKEEAHDYRYFPEPDLQPIVLQEAKIAEIKSALPELPSALFEKYVSKFGLSEYDASILTDNRDIALYYEKMVSHTKNYKAAANWLMGAIKSYLNERAIEISEFQIEAEKIASLIALIDSGKISNSLASQQLFPLMLKKPALSPESIAKEYDLIQESDAASLEKLVDGVIGDNQTEFQRYRNGEKNLFGYFMGQLMKASKGKADPKVAGQILKSKLEE